jgi:hypothetical protein
MELQWPDQQITGGGGANGERGEERKKGEEKERGWTNRYALKGTSKKGWVNRYALKGASLADALL